MKSSGGVGLSRLNEGDLTRLRAIETFSHGAHVFESGDVFLAHEDEATPLVFGTIAELADRQDFPPQMILDEMISRFGDLDRVGNVSLNEGVLSKFESKALSHGTRKTVVEGRALSWQLGPIVAKKRFMQLLSGLEATDFSRILAQLHTCLKTKQQSSEERQLPKKIPGEEARRRGLLPVGFFRRIRVSEILSETSGGRGKGYDYVGPEWAEFGLKLASFEEQLKVDFRGSLEIGRILTVEDKPAGATLFAPFAWKSNPPSRKVQKGLYYLMSGDLPGSWYRTGKVLKGIERERAVSRLARVLEANYRIQQPMGLKLKKRTFLDLAAGEMGCVQGVATSAWSEARIPGWKTRGNVPMDKVLHELDFELGHTKQ